MGFWIVQRKAGKARIQMLLTFLHDSKISKKINNYPGVTENLLKFFLDFKETFICFGFLMVLVSVSGSGVPNSCIDLKDCL